MAQNPEFESYDEDRELSIRTQTEIAVEAAMQLVPYVGPFLSAVYFGEKGERRFRRLEAFYQAVAGDVAALGEDVGEAIRRAVEASDPERIASILEELNDRVEVEALAEKRVCYQRYFENAVLTTVTEANYEERRLVLDVLGRLTPLQLSVVADLARENRWIDPQKLEVGDTAPDVIKGAVALLRSQGILDEVIRTTKVVDGEGVVNDTEVQLSGFGYRLHALCVEDPSSKKPDIGARGHLMFPVEGEEDALQSAPYELSDDEVRSWLSETPAQGRPADEVVKARRPLLSRPYKSLSVRLRPTVSGFWVVEWRVNRAEAETGMALAMGLRRVLDGKKPGYVAEGEAPFRHYPVRMLGLGTLESDSFLLSALEMDRVVSDDYPKHSDVQDAYARGRMISLKRYDDFQITFWPSDGPWIVSWMRKEGVPLNLSPALRTTLVAKEPLPRHPARDSASQPTG